jgi:MFS transporter, DHA2 family, multidrug resistance protein
MNAVLSSAADPIRTSDRGTVQRADAAAWLAVAAGTIGAMMATLDISIVNSSLPTIQGEIGATGSEGTWIATAYLVAEIIIIPLSGWLERMLGLRAFLLWAAVLFTGFSILCGLSSDLTTMVLGRVGQGFTGGAMIPTAQTIIATRLPKSQQPIGTAIFGAVAILGPVVGPIIGGVLTEQFSWHYAFLINVPIGAALVVLLMVALPAQPAKLNEFFKADWLGIVGLTLGLGGLTVVLEEGQREQWFSSSLIIDLSAVSVVGFILVGIGQLSAQRPIINLALLRDRTFGSVFVMGAVLGVALYGVAFIIPQFLSALAGYDALQSGKVVFLSGVPSLLLMPIVPLLMRVLEVRIAIVIGLLIMSLSCWIDASLTVQSSGGDFTVSQLLRGVGQIMAMLFLNQAAISAVDVSDASDASGLFNAARNLGGSVGLALLSTVQERRLYFHARTLESSISANAVSTQDYLAQLGSSDAGSADALARIGQLISQQALAMTYNDIFYLLAVGMLAILPLVLILKPIQVREFGGMH